MHVRPGRPSRVVAAALLTLSLAIGAVRLPGELSGQAENAAAGRRVARVGDLPVLAGAGLQRTRFLDLVRRTVPAGDSVRIVQQPTAAVSRLERRRAGTPGVCGYQASRLQYFWIVYALYPRPATCDGQARWTVYYGVAPPSQPPTATVHRQAADLVLVRR